MLIIRNFQAERLPAYADLCNGMNIWPELFTMPPCRLIMPIFLGVYVVKLFQKFVFNVQLSEN